MEKLFGIPMNNIMVVMLVLLIMSFAAVLWVALTKRVIFRMGMRNIPRRKTQSLLIVIGLMLATLISTAALTVGDSLNHSVANAVYNELGEVDHLVVTSNPSEGEDQETTANFDTMFTDPFPATAVEDVRAATEGLEVDSVGGMMITMAPVINAGNADIENRSNPMQILDEATASNPTVGISAGEQQLYDDFKLTDVDGNPLDVTSLGDNKVYVSQKLADDINVGVGDKVVYVINNQFYGAEVVGIVPNHLVAGGLNPGSPSMIVGLDHLRTALDMPDEWSTVLVSNTGDARSGLDHSDEVRDSLRTELGPNGFGINDIKKENVSQAELAGSIFTTMFIGFGLFSIAVGVLLIVLIFTMLAAERRPEMGMMRAVGGQRRQLIQQFLSEGAGYTLLSGLVGVVLGVGAAWIIAQAVRGMTGGLFEVSLYVHPRSLVVAYALGVIMTFAAVAFSSWRASRLNVVSAIRDIPEVHHARENRRSLILSIIGAIVGVALLVLGMTDSSLTLFLMGVTLAAFCLAQVLSWFGVNSKLVYTIASIIVIVVWAMPTKPFERIFGEFANTGGIELFFLSGISLVAATTILIMQHMDLLLTVVEALGTRVKGWLAAVRLGVAYPQSNGTRSGMTIAMFSLIVFSIVVMASVNNMISKAFLGGDAMAELDVEVQMYSTNTFDDITTELEAAGVNLDGVSTPGRAMTVGPALDEVQALNDDDEMQWYPLWSAQAVDDNWVDLTNLRFRDRAVGYESDEAVREALKNEPNTVIIPASLVAADTQSAVMVSGGAGATFDLNVENNVFEPYTMVARGESGEEVELKVIGVIDTDYSMLFSVYFSEDTLNGFAPDFEPLMTSYYYKLDDRSRSGEVAAEMESALLRYGAQAVDIEDMLEEAQAQTSGFMTMMQWFMGLGLIVGVAAVGVISYRAVVERRQQIGVLRSLGFQRQTVGRAFVIETGIIVILGSVVGAILGIVISYNLANDPTAVGTEVAFQVPWVTVLSTVGIAIAMALLMSWLPARQASRVLPAEALRYE